MTRVRYLILLSLVLVVSGCFAPRSFWSLPETDAIEEPIAILPVSPEHVIMTAQSEKDYLEMAEKTNSVLNTLAGGRNSKLLGPKKVRKILDKSDIESLHRILDESGDHSRVWKSERLAEMSKRLEVGKIIRVKVEILNPPAKTFKGFEKGDASTGKEWSGWVDVSADLFGMAPPKLITIRRGQKEFWGETAVVCLPVYACLFLPVYYAVGTSRARALDQAAREAIVGVLKEPTEDTVGTGPALGRCELPTKNTVSVSFLGTVTEVTQPALLETFAIGQVISGTYTFDTETPDQSPASNEGEYLNAVACLKLTIDGYRIENTVPGSITIRQFAFFMAARHTIAVNDISAPSVGSFDPISFAISFYDPSGSLFINDALPPVPPSLTEWPEHRWEVNFFDPERRLGGAVIGQFISHHLIRDTD